MTEYIDTATVIAFLPELVEKYALLDGRSGRASFTSDGHILLERNDGAPTETIARVTRDGEYIEWFDSRMAHAFTRSRPR